MADSLADIAADLAPVRAHYEALRAKRDKLIVRELAKGGGIREIARRAGVDPSQVMKLRGGTKAGR